MAEQPSPEPTPPMDSFTEALIFPYRLGATMMANAALWWWPATEQAQEEAQEQEQREPVAAAGKHTRAR